MHIAPHHSPEELRRIAKSKSKTRLYFRIQAIVLAQRGDTAATISQTLNTPLRTVESWIHRYNRFGLSGLEDQPRSGRKCRLDESQKARLRARLDAGALPEDGVCSLRGIDLRHILEEEFGVKYSLDGVYYLLHQLGYSSLAPRPQHKQANPLAQEAFKKVSLERSGKSKPNDNN